MYFFICSHKPHPFYIKKESYTSERIPPPFCLENLRMLRLKDAPLGIPGATINKRKQRAKMFRLRRLVRRYLIGLVLGFYLCCFFLSICHFCHFYSFCLFVCFFLTFPSSSTPTLCFRLMLFFHFCVRYH